jgi:hypothetical protein
MRGWCLALAGLLLAGCASPPEQAVAGDEPVVVTDPRDLANGTAPGSHIHDYWQGRTEVDVLDVSQDIGGVSYSGSDHGVIASFQPEEGTIVPQGTGELEAVLDWQAEEGTPLFPTEFTRFELWVKTAADSESHAVQTAEKGVPFRFNTTNEQDDPPHYTVSLWEFSLVVYNDGGDSMTYSGGVELRVRAFRTLPLVVFPPHPDPWAGARELVLHEEDGHAEQSGLVVTYSCTNGCLPWFKPDNGTVVPFDASEVVLVFEPKAGATPTPVSLDVHGADSRTFHTEAGQDQAGSLRFVIPVEPGMGDSPYARQSLWEFRIRLDTPMEQGAWQGDYHVVAKAIR